MVIKIKELLEASQALGKILNQPMEFKLGYRLRRITKKIMSEEKDFQEERNNLIKKYGMEDKNGSISVGKDNLEEYQKEINIILDQEITFDADLIPESVLIESQVKLTPAELVRIEPFITQEVKNEKTN